MNKQELINHIKDQNEWLGNHRFILIKKEELISMIEDIDQPQKVKVPAFVADWYEMNKKNLEYRIWNYIQTWNDQRWNDFKNWMNKNSIKSLEILTKMQYGYEVEEEPKWVVKSNRLYFTGITQLIARDPITYNFTTDEKRAHVFDDKESAEKEASFFDGTVEKVEV